MTMPHTLVLPVANGPQSYIVTAPDFLHDLLDSPVVKARRAGFRNLNQCKDAWAAVAHPYWVHLADLPVFFQWILLRRNVLGAASTRRIHISWPVLGDMRMARTSFHGRSWCSWFETTCFVFKLWLAVPTWVADYVLERWKDHSNPNLLPTIGSSSSRQSHQSTNLTKPDWKPLLERSKQTPIPTLVSCGPSATAEKVALALRYTCCITTPLPLIRRSSYFLSVMTEGICGYNSRRRIYM